MAFIRKIKRGKSIYLAEVENKRVNGKIIQKHIRYVGRELNGEKIFSGKISDAEVTKVTVCAPLLVLDSVAKRIHLSEILGDYGEYLLSLAYAHCLEPKSLNSMVKWFQKTDLHNILSISDVSEKKLYSALDSIDEENFDHIQKRIFSEVKKAYKLKPQGYFFDVTNVYFYGTECCIAKKGHNKEGTFNPQVQIGLAVTKEEGIPIFHKTFGGNIFDSRVLQEFLIKFHEYNIEEITIVWDRGCTSEDNLITAKNAGFEVICGLAIKQNVEKKVEEILEKKDKFLELKNRIRLKKTVLYCVKEKFSYGEIKGYFVLCFDEEKARSIKEKRIDLIYEAEEQLKKNTKILEGLKKYFNKDNTINQEKIIEEQKYDGLSALFSTRDLPVEEIVKPYFEKDKIEKAFRSMKSILGLRPIKHWLEERVKAHIFICYLSYLLISLLDHKIKRLKISANSTLEKLSTAYKVYLKDPHTKNEFTKMVTLSKEQEKIIKAVDKNLINHKM